MFRSLEEGQEQQASQLRRTAERYDVGFAVFELIWGQIAIIRWGVRRMAPVAQALEAADRELLAIGANATLGSHIKRAYVVADESHILELLDPAKEAALNAAAHRLGAPSGIQYVLGTTLHVLANIGTPSYWDAVAMAYGGNKSIGTILNTSVESFADAPILQLRAEHKRALARMDLQIRETEAALHPHPLTARTLD